MSVTEYLKYFFAGLADAAFLKNQDPSVTALVLGCLALWKKYGFWTAAAVFFLAYAGLSNVANVASSIRYRARPKPVPQVFQAPPQ